MKKNKKNKKIPNLEMINENKKLMKKIKKKNKIEDFIPVIVKERKKKKIIMPQSKDINLKILNIEVKRKNLNNL